MYIGMARIEIKGEELELIFKKLRAAEETVYECYTELQRLGVVKITKDEGAASSD